MLILCEDGPAPGPRLQARPSVGIGRPGRTGRPSRRARNGAEARTCRAMPRRGKVVHRILHEDLFGDCSSRGHELCTLMEKCKRGGARPAVLFMGQSGTRLYLYGRTCPASTHLWLRQIPQSPRLRRQPQRTQVGESHTRPPPLAAPGGTGGGHRAGGGAGSVAGAALCRWRRRSGRRQPHRFCCAMLQSFYASS